MKVSGPVGAKCVDVAKKLDGLELAAEFEFKHITHAEVVSGRYCDGLQSGTVQVRINGGESSDGESDGWRGTIEHAMRIAAADHGGRHCRSIGHIAAEGETSIGEDGAFQGKAGAHVRASAVAAGFRSGEKREAAAHFRSLLFCGRGGIVKDPQNGAIGNRTQSPLP